MQASDLMRPQSESNNSIFHRNAGMMVFFLSKCSNPVCEFYALGKVLEFEDPLRVLVLVWVLCWL